MITRRRDLDNTQHSHETDIHAPGGIRIHNLSDRVSADPRFRPHGHWDRPEYVIFTAFLRQQCLRERALMLRLRLFPVLFTF